MSDVPSLAGVCSLAFFFPSKVLSLANAFTRLVFVLVCIVLAFVSIAVVTLSDLATDTKLPMALTVLIIYSASSYSYSSIFI